MSFIPSNIKFRFSEISPIVIPILIQNCGAMPQIQALHFVFGHSAPYDCHTSLCRRSARTVGCRANQGTLNCAGTGAVACVGAGAGAVTGVGAPT